MTVLSTKPSDAADPRFYLPRSPHCPNDAPATIVAKGLAGTCGHCAWGFYTMESAGAQPGECPDRLGLVPVEENGSQLGYNARCGKVTLYRDKQGRVGALRNVGGQSRFFPGIEGNWALDRYIGLHPTLKGAAHASA